MICDGVARSYTGFIAMCSRRDRATRVSSAYAMPIGDGYMTKRFRLDELGHMVRPPRAITMAITHPPFASFSRAAPHSPPTSLGAAASALRLSPCLSFFLFRGATFLKF